MSQTENSESAHLDQLLDSTLESVDFAEAEVNKLAEAMGFDEEDLHRIGIAVRECMVNAVVHGNRYNARKKVHLVVTQTPDRLTVVIEDEGEGFEQKEVPDPLAEENLMRHSGRGLLLIQAFMDGYVTESRQPKGTRVTLTKHKPTTDS
jgi:serine/threonine-protein kinase RsbW